MMQLPEGKVAPRSERGIAMNIHQLVDDLGRLQAQIADLSAKEKAIKAALIAVGVGAYEGELFRASVSSSERETLDMKAVREKLSPQFMRAHTKVTQVNAVRVVAKKEGIYEYLPA